MARVGGWLLVLLFIAACRSPATPPTEGSPGVDCASLTRTHCMQSPDCTLEKIEGEVEPAYRCRPAAGPCETGLIQSAQNDCASRPGCRPAGGDCYCHCRGYGETAVPDGSEAEACACACGGGPPPGCVAEESATGPPPAAGGCASLSRTHCMQSPDCTLERVAKAQGGTGKLYRCRPAAGPCETGIRQADFHGRGTDGMRRAEEAQLACAARPGCDYDEGGCYCDCRDYGRTAVPDGPEAEDCMCECAGGPPPSCVAGAN